MNNEELDKEMERIYAQIDAYEKEVKEHNEKLLSGIKGNNVMGDFLALLDCSRVTDKIEYVSKPGGKNQNESIGVFKEIYVDQVQVGLEGDSFAGEIYAKVKKGKWLKITYEC